MCGEGIAYTFQISRNLQPEFIIFGLYYMAGNMYISAMSSQGFPFLSRKRDSSFVELASADI